MTWVTYHFDLQRRSSTLETQLFTSTFYKDDYAPPVGFCWDTMCREFDDPFMDDPLLEDYNVDQKVADFMAFIKAQVGEFVDC